MISNDGMSASVWSVPELLELEALEPGTTTTQDWATALEGDDQTLTALLRTLRRRSAAPAREPAHTSAPEVPAPRTGERRARRERRERKVSSHEGFRRATDPAYAEQLFRLSPALKHALVPVQRVLGLLRRALSRCPEARARLRWVPPSWSFALMQAALSEAAGHPVRLRGGTDLARGFGGRGSEFPRLGALLRGRDYYSDTSCDKAHREMEALGLGYRRPRLEPIPIECPKTGKHHPQRFGRKDVYVSVEVYEVAARLSWLRPLVRELRRLMPEWIWRRTRSGRRSRKKYLSFLEAVRLPKAEALALWEERRKAAAKLRRWRQRDAKKRANRRHCELTGTKVPITPAFSLSEKRGRAPAEPAGKVGASAPGTSGEASGPLSPTMAATGPPGRDDAREAPLDRTCGPEPPDGSARSARQGGGVVSPWSRYLPASPPERPVEPAPVPVAASKTLPPGPTRGSFRERLRSAQPPRAVIDVDALLDSE